MPADSSHPTSSISGNLVWYACNYTRRGEKRTILLLCGGPNKRDSSLFNLFLIAGFECVNYDIENGSQFDLVDDAVWEPLLRSIAAGEYAASCLSYVCDLLQAIELAGATTTSRR